MFCHKWVYTDMLDESKFFQDWNTPAIITQGFFDCVSSKVYILNFSKCQVHLFDSAFTTAGQVIAVRNVGPAVWARPPGLGPLHNTVRVEKVPTAGL